MEPGKKDQTRLEKRAGVTALDQDIDAGAAPAVATPANASALPASGAAMLGQRPPCARPCPPRARPVPDCLAGPK